MAQPKLAHLAPMLLLVLMSCVSSSPDQLTTEQDIGPANTSDNNLFHTITAADRSAHPPEPIASPYQVVHHFASVAPVPAGDASGGSDTATSTQAPTTAPTASSTLAPTPSPVPGTLNFDAANKDPATYSYTVSSATVLPGSVTLTLDASEGSVSVLQYEYYYTYNLGQVDIAPPDSPIATGAVNPSTTITAGTPATINVPIDASSLQSALSVPNKPTNIKWNVKLIDDQGHVIDTPGGAPLMETVPLAD
ncbi:MAG TPA: hypothetical protein V6D47_19050 [Oscillatoriaceae cyanobacterium]